MEVTFQTPGLATFVLHRSLEQGTQDDLVSLQELWIDLHQNAMVKKLDYLDNICDMLSITYTI